ncbi:atp-dependent dna helicase pif1, partial [Colletotrichum incanum]
MVSLKSLIWVTVATISTLVGADTLCRDLPDHYDQFVVPLDVRPGFRSAQRLKAVSTSGVHSSHPKHCGPIRQRNCAGSPPESAAGPSYRNRDGRCRFGFPYQRRQQTSIDPQGRVHFRRRVEEDAWVVPCIPALILYMDSYIHVDVCLSVNVFMYLFKYLFKGPDQTRFRMDDGSFSDMSNEYKDNVSA